MSLSVRPLSEKKGYTIDVRYKRAAIFFRGEKTYEKRFNRDNFYS